MRQGALLAMALLALLAAAPAQALGLRSGDHADRVRLVAEIPVGAEWQLGRTAAGYGLRLKRTGGGYDIAGVFERIRRNRVSGLTPVPGGLDLRLTCDPCHARAFLWREDRLVIDVVDGPAPQGSRFELMIDPPAPSAPPAPRRDRLLPTVFAGTHHGSMTPAPATSDPPPVPEILPGLAPLPAPPDLAGGFDDARREMIEGVARAAGQGLLDVSLDLEREVERVWATEPMKGATPPERLAARPGLAAQTGFDAGLTAAIRPEASDCPEPGWFDVETWADPEAGFAAGLVARRDAMAGEFGRVPAGAPEALARYYIHHGFGLEARAVLAIDGQRTRERVWLGLLADLVDGPVATPGLLAQTQDCTGPTVLWGALARGTVTDMSVTSRTAAIVAFRRLPDSLRGHLGERLARLFAEADDARGADEILRQAEAAPTGGTFEAEIAEAGIAGALEGPEAEIDELSSTAAQDARLTPDGLARLVGLMLEEGREVPGGLLELARALRFEHRGQPGELALAGVEARALIATGLHDAALDLVAATPLPAAEALALRGEAVIAMTEDLDEAAFIERAFAPLPTPLPAEAETALAARLLALGFAEAALARITGTPPEAEAEARAYLRAEAELSLGREEEARAALGGIDTPRADSLRARLTPLAEPSPEGRVIDLSEAELPGETETPAVPDAVAAWRAGDWESLAQSGDPLLEAASAAARSPAPDPSATASLAEGRALVEEAQAARALTAELLARFTLDPPGE